MWQIVNSADCLFVQQTVFSELHIMYTSLSIIRRSIFDHKRHFCRVVFLKNLGFPIICHRNQNFNAAKRRNSALTVVRHKHQFCRVEKFRFFDEPQFGYPPEMSQLGKFEFMLFAFCISITLRQPELLPACLHFIRKLYQDFIYILTFGPLFFPDNFSSKF